MSRGSNSDYWVRAIPQVVGLFILLGMLCPPVRRALLGSGAMGVSTVGAAAVGLVGFVVYRLARHSRRVQLVVRNLDWKELVIDVPADEKLPKSTAELVQRLRSLDWFQFEKLVTLVYQGLGYAVTGRDEANPEGCIDLVLEKEGQRMAIQCKQWKTWHVGVESVRQFLAALQPSGIGRGILITLCGYTGEAKQLAQRHGIEVVNGVGLARLLEDTGARSNPEAQAILQDTRKVCPKCESKMVLRTDTRGHGAGKQFWACSAHPWCRFTMPV